MKPEHEEFLKDHVEKMGLFFIVDFLKKKFPDLSHIEACQIVQEFERNHEESLAGARAIIKEAGRKIGKAVDEAIRKSQD